MEAITLSADEVQALRDAIEIIVDLAERTLDTCTDFNATLGGSTGLGGG